MLVNLSLLNPVTKSKLIRLGMAIFSEPDEESDTRFEWRRVWRNVLDKVKYLCNRVRRFFNSGIRDRDGCEYILSVLIRTPD